MDSIRQLTEWSDRETRSDDLLAAAPLRGLAATLDRDGSADDVLPPLSHWLFFLPRDRQYEIGPDGHPRRGGFLPPVPLPRRMWAGGRIDFLAPLQVGQRVTRISAIGDISTKSGRSGALVFVKVRHEIGCNGAVALVEQQDIVYRGAPAPGTPALATPPARCDEQFSRTISPDPVLLFRYSALTFNGHRIHYDRDYACKVEGYPGLVVHGPLIATLLVDLLRRHLPQARLVSFTFRAASPLFDTAPFDLCGRLEADGNSVALWARNAQGQLAMDAVATLG